MTIACVSDSAAGWLKLLDVAYVTPDTVGSLRPHEVDLLIVPGENERDAERAAVPGGRAGSSGRLDTSLQASWPDEQVFVWAPYTLKSAMDAALRLARVLDRLPLMMHVLGEREKALKALSRPRGEQSHRRPAAICLICDDACRVMGLWAPDLIERAGGEPLLLQAGDPSIPLRAEDLTGRPPDVIFAAVDGSEASEEAFRRTIPSEAPLEGEAYLVPPDMLLTSGPALHETVLRFSAALHGTGGASGLGANVLPRLGSPG